MQINLKIMLMDLNNLSKIKSELASLLKDNEILDVIIFGSFVKGKQTPNDIDIALIVNNSGDFKFRFDNDKYHVSVISINDFFKRHITLINTLFREGYSLKYGKNFSDLFGFSNKALFSYELTNLTNSNKVKLVNILRGKGKKGLVEENGGEWIFRQVFLVDVENERLFEDIFDNFKVKFKKSYILIH